MEEPSPAATPQLCRRGCGFYGSAQTEGMCSKCYKEHTGKINKDNKPGRTLPGPSDVPEKRDNESLALSNKDTDCAVSNPMRSLSTTDNDNFSPSTTNSNTNAVITSSDNAISTTTLTNEVVALTNQGNTPTNSLCPSPCSSASVTKAPSGGASPAKPKKIRCETCRKRVGLTGFSCRCGKIYCGVHRYSDQHNCDFDYKADARAKLRSENPVVVGEKIQKI